MSVESIQNQRVRGQLSQMTDVKVPALPEEYEAMFADTVRDVKDIVMKIRGKTDLDYFI